MPRQDGINNGLESPCPGRVAPLRSGPLAMGLRDCELVLTLTFTARRALDRTAGALR